MAQRFEFSYTPNCGSWLNMMEIEFSALVKRCLDRRFSIQEQLSKEVLAIIKERNKKGINIHWQFSIETARKKLNSAYTNVNALNHRYQKT